MASLLKYNWCELIASGYIRENISTILHNNTIIPDIIKSFITQHLLFNSVQQSSENDNNTPIFAQGKPATFWDETNKYYIKAKYKNIQQELISNKVYSIQQSQLDHIVQKASVCQKTTIFTNQTAKKRGEWNEICGIEKGSKMTLDHLIAIIVYADYSELHAKFMASFRSGMLQLQQETANFFRLIRESVLFFGDLLKENDKMYCGLNKKFHFNSCQPIIDYPLSITSEWSIAMAFASSNGIVVTFESADNKGPTVLDISWLSAYPNEKSHIIMNDRLSIASIVNVKNGTQMKVSVLSVWEKLLSGFIIKKMPEKEMQHDIAYLMRKYMYSKVPEFGYNNNDNERRELRHVQGLFNSWMDQLLSRNRKYIVLNKSVFLSDNADDGDGDDDDGLIQELKLLSFSENGCKNMYRIFLEMNGVSVIEIENEIWKIDGEQLDKMLKGNEIKCKDIIQINGDDLFVDSDDNVNVNFEAFCGISEADDDCKDEMFNFAVKLRDNEQSSNVEYEWEIWIPQIGFHFMCTHLNSRHIQHDLFNAQKLKSLNNLDIQICVRLI